MKIQMYFLDGLNPSSAPCFGKLLSRYGQDVQWTLDQADWDGMDVASARRLLAITMPPGLLAKVRTWLMCVRRRHPGICFADDVLWNHLVRKHLISSSVLSPCTTQGCGTQSAAHPIEEFILGKNKR